MKIASATGFAVVCTTELAFEYLKQTEQIKLIVLITRPLRPYSATRGFCSGFSTVRFTAVALQDAGELYTSFHAPFNALQQFKINNRAVISIYRHARVF